MSEPSQNEFYKYLTTFMKPDSFMAAGIYFKSEQRQLTAVSLGCFIIRRLLWTIISIMDVYLEDPDAPPTDHPVTPAAHPAAAVRLDLPGLPGPEDAQAPRDLRDFRGLRGLRDFRDLRDFQDLRAPLVPSDLLALVLIRLTNLFPDSPMPEEQWSTLKGLSIK